MKLKLATVAVALLLVATGAAVAMPGNAPDQAQADDHPADDHAADDADDADDADADAMNESEYDADEREEINESDADENETGADKSDDAGPPADVPAASGDDASGDAGPPADLPPQVPDFVSQIHSLIDQHVNGDRSGQDLGSQLSDLLSTGDESGNADAAASGQ
jgi:hypothetical protein